MKKLRTYPKRLFWGIYFVSMGVGLVLQPLLDRSDKLHHHFWFQDLPGFFAVFGFAGCMLLILIARAMGMFISTGEDYYGKRSEK